MPSSMLALLIPLGSTHNGPGFFPLQASPERSQNGGVGGQRRCGHFLITRQGRLPMLQGLVKPADVLHVLLMACCLASQGSVSVGKPGEKEMPRQGENSTCDNRVTAMR